ncbi:hypothetical protein D6C76_10619 [Aureobasidium pullulans]|nr:hypothetical protein D6C76_10619 [Aureobasidium pullulans]
MSLVALQPANEDPEDSDAEVRQPQRRRVSDPEEDDFAGGEASIIQGDGNFDAMVKNMVRLALACEYSRTPIRHAPAQYRQTIRPPDSKTPSSSPVNSTEPWVERAEEATRLHVLRLRPDSGMPPTMPTKPPPPPPLNMEGIKKVLAQRYVPTSLCSSTMLINLLNQTLIVVPYILLLGNAADDACKASTSPAAQHGGDQEGLAPGPRDSPYLPPFSPI